MKQRGRSEASFERKQKTRAPRACVLIVCEDAKSAPNYFNALRTHLRLSTAEVNVFGEECGSDPLSVVNFAIERRNQRNVDVEQGKPNVVPFDFVFCVVDVDKHTTLKEALIKARDHAIEFVVSCPCFEYWYLLHFGKTSRAFEKCDQLIKSLKKHLPGYDKGTFKPHQLITSTATAHRHAGEIEREQMHDGRLCNPSTRVHHLIEKLCKIAEQEGLLATKDVRSADQPKNPSKKPRSPKR